MDTIMSLSLSEINTLNEIKDGVQFVRDKVVKHDTQLKDVLGNGRPGRLAEVEKMVQELNNFKWKLVGILIGCMIFIEGTHIGFEKVFEHLK